MQQQQLSPRSPGFVVLGQQLAPVQMVVIGFVVVACTGALRTGEPRRRSQCHDEVGRLIRREADE
jgi:threonine/homoserine efflux transporter RhtA